MLTPQFSLTFCSVILMVFSVIVTVGVYLQCVKDIFERSSCLTESRAVDLRDSNMGERCGSHDSFRM